MGNICLWCPSTVHSSITLLCIKQHDGVSLIILTHPSYSLQTLKQNKNDEGNLKKTFQIFPITSSFPKATVLAVLVSLCVAQKPGPYKEVPKPYSYQYGVADDYSKANFQHTEAQDGNVT